MGEFNTQYNIIWVPLHKKYRYSTTLCGLLIYIMMFSNLDSPFVSNYLLLFSPVILPSFFILSHSLLSIFIFFHLSSPPTSLLCSPGLSLWQHRCGGVDRSTDNVVHYCLSANNCAAAVCRHMCLCMPTSVCKCWVDSQ